MAASSSRVLRNKRRIHISTLCEECSEGLSEKEQHRHIDKLYMSESREPKPWRAQVWEVRHTFTECKKIMDSVDVKLHITLMAGLSY